MLHGDHYYFFYNSGIQNQNVMYKIKAANEYVTSSDDATKDAEVFLDPNELADDGTARLGEMAWCDNGRYLAYQVMKKGSEWATILIRDEKTGKDHPDEKLKWVKFSNISWTNDSKGFFYSKFDPPKDAKATGKLQNQKVYYHRVGTKQTEDQLIYKNEGNPNWQLMAFVSNDGKYLFLDEKKDRS